jgi:MFS family permease
MQKLPISKYLSVLVIIWGAILAFTSLSKSFIHLMVFRFFLGLFEAAVLPCIMLTVNTLYRQREQTIRIPFIFACGGFAWSAGGLLVYGIGHMDGIGGLKAWQW